MEYLIFFKIFFYVYNLDMQGTGNINYSLNKNDFHTILKGGITYFIPHYYILVIISLLYIYTIKYKQYFFSDRDEKYKTDKDIIHFFKSITYNSPLDILKVSESVKNDDKFVGLSNISYIYIIVAYIITFIIILEGLIRNLLYSIYVSIIQVNPNNNPYKNNDCITKIKDNPYIKTIQNYSAVLSMSLNFLVPFLIPFLISFLKFDNYDIKHNKWMSYIILYLVFFPLITVLLSRATFYKKLEIFPDLERFVETKDNSFIKFIINNFNFKISTIIIFIFVIFVYCYYTLVYSDLKYTIMNKIIIYLIIFSLLFIFIPIVIIFFSLSLLFDNKINNKTSNNVIDNIKNNGICSLYDLLVKYNYPCFFK